MKLLIIAAFIIVTVMGAWWLVDWNKPAIEVEPESALNPTDNDVLPDPAVQEVTEAVELPVVTVQDEAPANVEQAATDDTQASPFNVVPDDDGSPSTQAQSNRVSADSPSRSTQSTNEATQASSDRISTAPVVVPERYPESDAAKYYIPADQRGPGRLGGPPPINFTFGQGETENEEPGTFGPPPSPGQ